MSGVEIGGVGGAFGLGGVDKVIYIFVLDLNPVGSSLVAAKDEGQYCLALPFGNLCQARTRPGPRSRLTADWASGGPTYYLLLGFCCLAVTRHFWMY